MDVDALSTEQKYHMEEWFYCLICWRVENGKEIWAKIWEAGQAQANQPAFMEGLTAHDWTQDLGRNAGYAFAD